MKPFAPLALAAVFAVGCAKDAEVRSAADAEDDGRVVVDLTPDVTPDVDLPDVDLPDVDLPDLDADDDGFVEVDLTPDITPDIDLPDLDADDDGEMEIDFDENDDGIVSIDAPDVTPDIDLPDLDADGDGRIELDLDDDDRAVSIPAPDLGLPDVDLDDVSASCPAALADVDLDVAHTGDGVELTFTTDSAEDLTALRQLAARLAMDHTVSNDGLPDMEGRTVRISGRTQSGRAYVITSGLPFRELRHRSYATVVGVEDGVKVVLEPRPGTDVDAVQGMGDSFADKLEVRCDVAV